MNRHLALITEYVLSSSKSKPMQYKLPLSVEMAVILATQQEPRQGDALSSLLRALAQQLNSPILSQFSSAFILFLRFFFNNLSWRNSFFSSQYLQKDRGVVFLNLGVLAGPELAARLKKIARFSRSNGQSLTGLVVIPISVFDSLGEIRLSQVQLFAFGSKACGSVASFVALQPSLVGLCGGGAGTNSTATPLDRSPAAPLDRLRPASVASADARRSSRDRIVEILQKKNQNLQKKSPKLSLPSLKKQTPPQKFYPILYETTTKEPIKSLRKIEPVSTRVTRRSLVQGRPISAPKAKEGPFTIRKPGLLLVKTLSRNVFSDSAKTLRPTRHSGFESPAHSRAYPALKPQKISEAKLVKRRENFRSPTSEGNSLSLSFDVTKIKS